MLIVNSAFSACTPQKSNANVERALRFIPTFTAEAPHRRDESCRIFIQDLLSEIVTLTSAACKTVRIKACSLLAAIMRSLKIEIEDQTLNEIEEAMMGRLKDKVSCLSYLLGNQGRQVRVDTGMYNAVSRGLLRYPKMAIPAVASNCRLQEDQGFVHSMVGRIRA